MEMMARVPIDHAKESGVYPEGNGEPLLKNENDIRFALLKCHLGHRARQQCAVT